MSVIDLDRVKPETKHTARSFKLALEWFGSLTIAGSDGHNKGVALAFVHVGLATVWSTKHACFVNIGHVFARDMEDDWIVGKAK